MAYSLTLIADNNSADPVGGGPFRHFVAGIGAGDPDPVPLLSQLLNPDAQRANDCGETVDAMLLSVGGYPTTIGMVIGALGHDGVTNTTELLRLLVAKGAVVPYQGTDFGVVASLLGDEASFHCANPWPDARGRPRAPTYSRAAMVAAHQWSAVIRWPSAAPVSTTPTTGPAHAAQEDAVNPADIDSWNGTAHIFKCVGTGTYAGALQHRWYSPATGWNNLELLAVGLTGGCHIEATVAADRSALVVSVNRPDGRTARFTQFAGKGIWVYDDIAA